jgi:hypothetical protein
MSQTLLSVSTDEGEYVGSVGVYSKIDGGQISLWRT